MKTSGFATILVLLVVVLVGGVGVGWYLSQQGVIPKFTGPATSEQPPVPPEITEEDAGREPNGSAETADWKTYTSTKYGYTIQYPERIYELGKYLKEGKTFSLQYCPAREQGFVDCGAPGFNYLAIQIDEVNKDIQGNTFEEKIKDGYSFDPPECIKRSTETKVVEENFLGRQAVTYEYIIDEESKETFCKGEHLAFGENKRIAVDHDEGVVVIAIVNASSEAKTALEKVISTFKFLD